MCSLGPAEGFGIDAVAIDQAVLTSQQLDGGEPPPVVAIVEMVIGVKALERVAELARRGLDGSQDRQRGTEDPALI